MKKLIINSTLLVLIGFSAMAQGTDDPYLNLRKFYTSANSGTARSQAMGGAFTALGADLSNTYINPAGLGFYNRSEFSGTFNFEGNKVNTDYIGQNNNRNRSSLDLGQIGVVLSKRGVGTRMRRGSFGISYSTLANFSNSYKFSGENNSSTISDAFAELANGSGLTPEEIAKDYDEFKNAPYGYSMAVMGGLVQYFDNTFYDSNEGIEGFPVMQSGEVVESGNLGQLNFSYGANFDDKTYVGIGLGVQLLNYGRSTTFDEVFANKSIYLKSQYYDNELNIIGSGVNLTVGVIQRLNNFLNLGATVTTPSLMWVTDSFNQFAGVDTKTSDAVLYYTDAKTAVDEFKYKITSPLKANLGLSAFLPNQWGVVSVEAEYLGYSRMNIKDKNDQQWSDSQSGLIQDEFKDVVNLKAGMELKKGIGRLRAGVNLINDPLRYPADFNVKKNYAVGSVGLGVRKSNFFADLTYSWHKKTAAYTPYWLANDTYEYYSVGIKRNISTVGLTIGSFF